MTNEKYLNLVYQNIQIAIQSIEKMYPKFRSSKLKQLMKKTQEQYTNFKNECITLAKDKKITLKDTNVFMKFMLSSSICLNTIFDKSSSHIAELFLLGTVRGTIKLYKHLKESKNIDDDILTLSNSLLSFEEQSYNEIKNYLKA